MSAKQLVDLALEKFRKGDVFGSVRYVRDAIKQNRRAAIAYGVLACLYSDENELELANKAVFRGMHECRDYDSPQFNRQLALNFLQMNMPEVASYYAQDGEGDLLDSIDTILNEFENEHIPDLYLSYPPGDDYYEHMLQKAYELANDGDMDGAIGILDTIPEKYNDVAAKSKMVVYTMNNDVDSVIDFGERMIRDGRDNVAIRCALASAYLMKNRNKEAAEAVAPIFENQSNSLETMFMVLPIAVSLDMHGEVIKIISAVFERPGFRGSKRLMLWYSQALYNVGQTEAAKAIMSDLNVFYGEDAPAFYYLEKYAQKPEKVEYSLTLPQDGFLRNMNKLRDIMLMSDDEIAAYEKTHTAVGDNLEYYVQYALANGNKSVQNALISRLVFYRRSNEIFQNCLVSGDLPYAIMNAITDSFIMLNDGIHPVVFDIVAQDRFKHIEFMPPRAIRSMPSVLRSAVLLSIADIVFTDEDPNFYLKRLTSLINEIVDLNTDGKPVYSNKNRAKLSGARSEDTLLGVFLAKVYEEDETRDTVIERYKLNPKLYDKYYNIVFGEEND